MNFPMSLADISLWLAGMAIITLITSEIICIATEYSGNYRKGPSKDYGSSLRSRIYDNSNC